jgi:preprotein translocase subunit SecE
MNMQKLVQYFKDVRAELVKVSWPTRNEVTGATLLVVVSSIMVSVFVYAVDRLLMTIINLFLK